MGLDNHTRSVGLIFAVKKMYEFGKGTRLEHLTSKLWPALIGSQPNNSHWIIGSSTSRAIKKYDTSLWAISILCHVRDDEDEIERDNVVEQFLSISALLEEKGFDKSKEIFEIFRWTEQAVYYLRRYPDEFFRENDKLNDIICNIQGECFSIFHEEEDFAKAYIINNIMEIAYGPFYPFQRKRWNALTRWLVDHNVHHNLNRCMEMQIEDLVEIHKSVLGDKSMKNLVVNLGKLMVRRLHKYEDDKFMKQYISKEMFDRAKKLYVDHNRVEDNKDEEIYG